MGQNKIIISVRISDVNCAFTKYSPHGGEKCFEAYKLLLKKNSEVFADDDFLYFLKSIFVEEDGEKEFFFEEQDRFNFNSVFENDNFTDWIKSKENKIQFIIQLTQRLNDKQIIRKHNTEEIYVVPLLNDSYNDENVEYTEKLIAALRQDGDDLWLLLHDKDLYSINKSYHPANISEFHEGRHEVLNCSELKSLIENNKVFTFIHSDSDHFFAEVINKLDELTIDGIISELVKSRNVVSFTKEIAKCIKKGDMTKVLENAPKYDFSKKFLELDANE